MSENEIIGPYQIGRTIGAGIFAKVKLGEDEFRQKVAVKIFDKTLLSKSQHQLLQVEKELNSLRCCHHPNVVQFYEVLETETQIFLVMEHLNGGELYDFILDHGKLSEVEGGRLFGQILSAVHHCHTNGIVHRDLKPENILLTQQLQRDGTYRPSCKLVDFGLANYYDTNIDALTRTLATQCGSPHYASPEILTGQKYSGPLADIWSLGVLLYAMLCGSLPFNARSVPLLIKKIVEGKFKFPKFLSPASRHLIQTILQIQPENRPRIDEIVRHPWIMQYGQLDQIYSHYHSVTATGAKDEDNENVDSNSHTETHTIVGHTPPLYRPLSRPEIINPESSRPQPGDLHKMVNKPQRKSMTALLPHSDQLNFPLSEESHALVAAQSLSQSQSQPHSLSQPHSSTLSSPVSFLTDLLSPRKRNKPIQCQFCGKALNARVSESGDYTLSNDGLMGSKYELCTCLRSRTNSPTSQSRANVNISVSPLAQSQSQSQSRVTQDLSSDSLGFQTNSLRENYFHRDDPRRKSKPAGAIDINTTTSPNTSTDSTSDSEEELIRRKNEEMFLRACEIGDVLTVVTLIEPPVDGDGFTVGPPLVDVRAKAIDNWTGLHYAARNGHIEVVQSLLSSLQPIDINCRTKNSWSALMCAADKGHSDVCQLLVKYGAAIHITNSDGKSAIFLARESGFHDIAQMLTNASSIRHKRHALISGADSDVHSGGVNGASNTQTERELNYELFRAAEYGDVSKVKHLLQLNSIKQEEHVSRRSQQSDINTNTSMNSSNESPAQTSPSAPSPTRYSVDVCSRGIDHWTALHFASRKGRTPIVEILLNHRPPAPVNAVTKNGWTALMMACDKGFTDIVRLLLSHGADPSIVALDGDTAAKIARESAHDDCAELIYQHIHAHTHSRSSVGKPTDASDIEVVEIADTPQPASLTTPTSPETGKR